MLTPLHVLLVMEAISSTDPTAIHAPTSRAASSATEVPVSHALLAISKLTLLVHNAVSQ